MECELELDVLLERLTELVVHEAPLEGWHAHDGFIAETAVVYEVEHYIGEVSYTRQLAAQDERRSCPRAW